MTRPILCFGELMFRLSCAPGEKLMRSGHLAATLGGAEANVAVGLAHLGTPSAFASSLPQNDLGIVAVETLRGHGVDTSLLALRDGGRMGLYFFTPGAVTRPSEVMYDRAASTFAQDPALDLAAIEQMNPLHIHLSGITPAVSARTAQATLDLIAFANARDIPVSFDGNYRAKLWAAWGGNGPATLAAILAGCSMAFIDWRDIGLILGGEVPEGDHNTRNAIAYARAFEAFPRLSMIAATQRRVISANQHKLAAQVVTRQGQTASAPEMDVSGIIDRIGTGDAFVAGFLHRLRAGKPLEDVIAFARTCGAAKHGIWGDMSPLSADEIEQMMTSGIGDVQR